MNKTKKLVITARFKSVENKYVLTTDIKGYSTPEILVEIMKHISSGGEKAYGANFSKLVQQEFGGRYA